MHICIVENGEDVAGVGREGEGELFVFICVMPLITISTAVENLTTFFNFNNDLNTSQSTPAFSRLPSTSSLSPDQSGNMREMMAFAFWNLKLVPQFLPRLSQRISQPEFFNRLLTSQLLELQQSRVGSKVAAGASKAEFCPLTDKITTAASTTLESSGQGHVGRDGKFYLFLRSWKSIIISNYLENIKSCFKSFDQFRMLTWFGAYLLKYVIPLV